MAVALRFIRDFTRRHPVTRGMLTYGLLWPASNITQQLLERRSKIDWIETGRFSLFGGTFVAPTLYAWVRIIGKAIPGNTLKVAVSKALVEMIVYSPFAISTFYVGIGILEGKKLNETIEEMKAKFIPTWKTAACIWPMVQTLNFAFVKERNRVMVTGTVSFFWTVYMSYMKHLQLKSPSNSPVLN